MKKQLAILSCALLAISAWAQGALTIVTEAPAGSKVTAQIKASGNIGIDAGDGTVQNFPASGFQGTTAKTLEITVKGSPLKFSGDITSIELHQAGATAAYLEGMKTLSALDLSNNNIEDFAVTDKNTTLTQLNLSNNALVNSVFEATLGTENTPALVNLDLSGNPGLVCLDMRNLAVLETLDINDCESFGSLFICMPEDMHQSLRRVSINNCDLTNFYPVSLPALTELSLRNNVLMNTDATDNPFVLGDYPALRHLDISQNRGVRNLSVTACKELLTLAAADCDIRSLDLGQCTKLTTLDLGGNAITSIDLGACKALTDVSLADNKITSLEIKNLTALKKLDISSTSVPYINLANAPLLTSFNAAGTLLGWVDFTAQSANVLKYANLSGLTAMTGATADYTIKTLPSTTGGQLLLAESNAGTADIASVTSRGWTCDITGDATASHPTVKITAKQTSGGTYTLTQPQAPDFRNAATITASAAAGVPVHIVAQPAQGQRFMGVKVDGVQVSSEYFVPVADCTVEAVFGPAENFIRLTTTPGQEMSMMLSTTTQGGKVWIDWGTGSRTEYAGRNAYTFGTVSLKGERIDGTAVGNTVTLYGDIAAADLSGFGDVAWAFGLWDNAISAIDISGAPDLQMLNVYWNPIRNINLAGADKLTVLDVSYTALRDLDLSGCPNLVYLAAYSDGYGDEDEGISQLRSIDVTRLPFLQYLDVKGNELTSLDVTQNPMLFYLNANNNDLTALDVTANTELVELNANLNRISSINLTDCPLLMSLSLTDNLLTDLDLSNNDMLRTLLVGNNDLHALDLSKNTMLSTIHANGNSLSAEEINDFYYRLPKRYVDPNEEEGAAGTTWNLAMVQGSDKAGQSNEATRADSSIATDREWTPSHQGTNGGCTTAYLDIIDTPYGEVWVEDTDGNQYRHGHKVPKYTDLTVKAKPAPNYVLTGYQLNADLPRMGKTFKMPGIYTKMTPTFAWSAGAENVTADSGRIYSIPGAVILEGLEGTATVYTTDGRTAATAPCSQGHIFLTPGTYIVATPALTAKVIVK